MPFLNFADQFGAAVQPLAELRMNKLNKEREFNAQRDIEKRKRQLAEETNRITYESTTAAFPHIPFPKYFTGMDVPAVISKTEQEYKDQEYLKGYMSVPPEQGLAVPGKVPQGATPSVPGQVPTAEAVVPQMPPTSVEELTGRLARQNELDAQRKLNAEIEHETQLANRLAHPVPKVAKTPVTKPPSLKAYGTAEDVKAKLYEIVSEIERLQKRIGTPLERKERLPSTGDKGEAGDIATIQGYMAWRDKLLHHLDQLQGMPNVPVEQTPEPGGAGGGGEDFSPEETQAVQILMDEDGMTEEEAMQAVREARQ